MIETDSFAPAPDASSAPPGGIGPAADTSGGYDAPVTYGSLATAETHEAAVDALRAADPDLAADLAKTWGTDLRQNLAFADRAASTLGSPELVVALSEAGLDRHPALVRALALAGRQLATVAGDAWSVPSRQEIASMTHATPSASSSPVDAEQAARDLRVLLREGHERRNEGTYTDPEYQDRLSQAFSRAYPEPTAKSHLSTGEAARLDAEIAAMNAKVGTEEWFNVGFQDRLSALYRRRWNGPAG